RGWNTTRASQSVNVRLHASSVPSGVISTTVHPPGLAHGKGYQRAHLEPHWGAYCGQNTPPDQTGTSEACERASADKMGTTRDFSSVQEGSLHGLKNGKLSYSHAGLHACTDRKGGNGGEGHPDQEVAPPDVPASPKSDAPATVSTVPATER